MERVVCEVNAHVDASVAGAYLDWLRPHVREILAIEGFVEAVLYEREAEPDGRRHWTVQYVLRDRAALDAYLEHHAPRLRQDGIDRFGTHLTTDRRILHERETFRP